MNQTRNPARGILYSACWTMLAAIAIVGVCALIGCADPNATFDEKQKAVAGAMAALEKARFKGDIDLNMAGSPLGLNASTNWSLGPAQSTLHIRGEVDFSQPPRPVTP